MNINNNNLDQVGSSGNSLVAHEDKRKSSIQLVPRIVKMRKLENKINEIKPVEYITPSEILFPPKKYNLFCRENLKTTPLNLIIKFTFKNLPINIKNIPLNLLLSPYNKKHCEKYPEINSHAKINVALKVTIKNRLLNGAGWNEFGFKSAKSCVEYLGPLFALELYNSGVLLQELGFNSLEEFILFIKKEGSALLTEKNAIVSKGILSKTNKEIKINHLITIMYLNVPSLSLYDLNTQPNMKQIDFLKNEIDFMLKKFPLIDSLVIESIHNEEDFIDLVNYLETKKLKIKHLLINNCKTNNNLCNYLSKQTELEFLKINECSKIEDFSFTTNLNKLKTLHLKNYENLDKKLNLKLNSQLINLVIEEFKCELIKIEQENNQFNLRNIKKLEFIRNNFSQIELSEKIKNNLEYFSLIQVDKSNGEKKCEINFEDFKNFKNIKNLIINRYDFFNFSNKIDFTTFTNLISLQLNGEIEEIKIHKNVKYLNINCFDLENLFIPEDSQLEIIECEGLCMLKNLNLKELKELRTAKFTNCLFKELKLPNKLEIFCLECCSKIKVIELPENLSFVEIKDCNWLEDFSKK